MTENRLPEKRVNGRFVKGQSGNPGGRPKALSEFVNTCQSLTPELVGLVMEVARKGRGNDKVAAAALLWSYGFGKPAQAVSLEVQTVFESSESRQARIMELQQQIEEPDACIATSDD